MCLFTLPDTVGQECNNSILGTAQDCSRTGNGTVNDVDSLNDVLHSDVDLSDYETQARVMCKMKACDTESNQAFEVKHFLNKLDNDISRMLESSSTNRDSINEVISVLTNKSVLPLQKPWHKMDGADCGVRWWVVLLAAVLLVMFVLFIYLLYVKYFHAGR